MFQLILISACALAVVSTGFIEEQGGSEIHGLGITSLQAGGEHTENVGAGNGLAHIAVDSSDVANNAVLGQHLAGRQAASAARNSYADVAAGAAARAQAALEGKLTLLGRLERELQDAHEDIAAESQQLQLAERAANSAHTVIQLAQTQLNTVNSAANAARSAITHATEAFNAANTKLGTQAAMVGAAQRKFSRLAQELSFARDEYQATQAAAQQAAGAALLAQSSASQANDNAGSGLGQGLGADVKSLSSNSFGFGNYHH